MSDLNSRDALKNILNQSSPRLGLGNRRRWTIIGGGLLLLLVLLPLIRGGKDSPGQFITEPATMGNLTVTVSATGTLQPTTSIDVGSEQSGTLAAVLVEENDRVKRGQLLARLDLAKLQDAVSKSRAALAAAEASVAQARATVKESKASLARMRQVAELSGGKVPSKAEMETAEATLERALANEASANAAVLQAQATLKTDETNLSKGAIRSPVNGVVLSRKVEPGQTLVAAMTIPVLFTLAEDLTNMELQVKVDEADVSSVKLGQPASFTVSAWPGRTFPATIRRVGIGSTITDNVVTYKTLLNVKNADMALRPGMTATASIVTAQRKNVLLVPNAALRFAPPTKNSGSNNGSFVSNLLPRPPSDAKRSNTTSPASSQVWVLSDSGPQAIAVKTGVSNGRQTEIEEGELKPDMAVITEYQEVRP
ncbi:MAG: efflux RND transporter periplasmic adaptor subunit [Nitrosomonadales bacterium]|nr:efflux RND transporter periplasmic adaptor subunit [Nitrosomonadales bacterium]